MQKIRVGLVFGGRSGEHEVSIMSAKSIYAALDKNKYDVELIGIDKSGGWHLQSGGKLLSGPEEIKQEQLPITAITKGKVSYLAKQDSGERLSNVDIFFPIVHGTNGEDGTLQGLFELLDVAYVGAGVLGSAVGMDKDVMKRLLKQAGIPVAKWVALKRHETGETIVNEASEQLGWPVFVKPANMGSSVGVSKANDDSELKKAVKLALTYDNKILIEEAIRGREIECSVLGNDKPTASVPGEVKPTHDFYDYEAKYIDEHGAALEIPANLTPEEVEKIQKLAINTFKVLECSGMGRVDMFLQPDGKVIINEINTLPGFTKISMYPKLWEMSGIPYPKLLDKLIELGLEKKQEKDRLKRSYI
jgi:D-alanine-D-alanine ligase